MGIAPFAWLMIATTQITQPPATLRGKVTAPDSTSIVAAQVTLHDARHELKAVSFSDSAGRFLFSVPNVAKPITLHLSVRQVGYAPIEYVPIRVASREVVTVNVQMKPLTIPLRPVTAMARRRLRSAALDDYYDKAEDVKRGVGRVLDRAALERYSGLELLNVLDHVPGVEQGRAILPNGIGLTLPRMANGCIPLTFLDRVPILPEDLAAINPADLEGVLIYVGGSQLPADYSRLMAGAECGLILAYRAAPPRRPGKKSVIGVMLIVGAYAAFVLSHEW